MSWSATCAAEPAAAARRWRLLIALWFALFWGVFLPFYAGSYKYGADVRFALVSFMPLAVLAGYGAGAIRDALGRPRGEALLTLVVLLSWMTFLPSIRLEGQEA